MPEMLVFEALVETHHVQDTQDIAAAAVVEVAAAPLVTPFVLAELNSLTADTVGQVAAFADVAQDDLEAFAAAVDQDGLVASADDQVAFVAVQEAFVDDLVAFADGLDVALVASAEDEEASAFLVDIAFADAVVVDSQGILQDIQIDDAVAVVVVGQQLLLQLSVWPILAAVSWSTFSLELVLEEVVEVVAAGNTHVAVVDVGPCTDRSSAIVVDTLDDVAVDVEGNHVVEHLAELVSHIQEVFQVVLPLENF